MTNSFAVPYESDKKDPTVWFVDHNHLEEMAAMFRKVNAREFIVGFYSSENRTLRSRDRRAVRRFCKDPHSPLSTFASIVRIPTSSKGIQNGGRNSGGYRDEAGLSAFPPKSERTKRRKWVWNIYFAT